MTLAQLPIFEILTGLLSLGGWYLHREFKRVKDDAERDSNDIRQDLKDLKEDRIKPIERHVSHIIAKGAKKEDIDKMSESMQISLAEIRSRLDRIVDGRAAD